jgi:hypothetical protein
VKLLRQGVPDSLGGSHGIRQRVEHDSARARSMANREIRFEAQRGDISTPDGSCSGLTTVRYAGLPISAMVIQPGLFSVLSTLA